MCFGHRVPCGWLDVIMRDSQPGGERSLSRFGVSKRRDGPLAAC